ncbi:MAG: hypothetical protein HQL59_03815 [Magnetococcales bacterium]|nr:hypothetical protein [Magnetococcales bacterium]
MSPSPLLPILVVELTRGESPRAPLSIGARALPSGRSWRGTVSFVRFVALRSMVEGFRQATRPGTAAPMVSELLLSLGIELFDACFAPFWEKLRADPREEERSHLTIALISPELELLNLPWELTRLPGGGPIALEPEVTLFRAIAPAVGETGSAVGSICLERWSEQGRVTPASLLLAAPAEVLRAIGFPSAACSEVATLPGWPNLFGWAPTDRPPLTELRDRLCETQATRLHLCGECRLHRQRGYFFWEPTGLQEPEPVSGRELVEQVIAGTAVKEVILSPGREQESLPTAAIAGLCVDLAAHGAPLALSWPLFPGEGGAGRAFLLGYYRESLSGTGAGGPALTMAGRQVQEKWPSSGVWALPARYSPWPCP